MTRALFALLPIAALAAASALAIGDRLPPLRGEYLTGLPASLPEDASGRVTLLLLGFTHQSRHAIDGWAGKFRARFGSEPQVRYFEIPVIGGMGRVAKPFIESGMRKGTAKADYEHVITVFGGADLWKRAVEFHDPNTAYLILLNRSGKVAWRHSGAFEEGAFAELSEKVGELLATK